jgi:hypothetical protein
MILKKDLKEKKNLKQFKREFIFVFYLFQNHFKKNYFYQNIKYFNFFKEKKIKINFSTNL